MAKAPSPPPFTRLHAPDPQTNRVLQDLYDKLNQVAQSQAQQNGIGPSAAPSVPTIPPANLRRITKSYTLTGSDHTVSANVQAVTSVLLPPSENVQGLGPFTIHNETGSGASISLGSARKELVGGVPATSHILAPGETLIVQPHPGYWITVGASASAASGSGFAGITGASPSIPSAPLTPTADPGLLTFANAPTVTALPGPADPLSIVGNYITFNGVQYVFTLPLTGAGDGYWAAVATTSTTIRDTFANLGSYPAANYSVGTVFTATDLLVSYAVQLANPGAVKTWVYYNGVYSDVIANLPGGLGTADKNFQFHATDYLHNWIWNGSAWHLTTGGFPPGYQVYFSSPSMLPPGALWHLCDGSTQNISQDDGTLLATVLPTVAGLYIVQ